MEDTQPLTICDKEEEQVHYIGENLRVRRLIQEQRKFFQLTRKSNATGEFIGITLDAKQFEKLCHNSNYLISKLADVDMRGEKVAAKVDLGDELMATIDWRFPGIGLRMFWTTKEGEQKATRRGIHFTSSEFNQLCVTLSNM